MTTWSCHFEEVKEETTCLFGDGVYQGRKQQTQMLRGRIKPSTARWLETKPGKEVQRETRDGSPDTTVVVELSSGVREATAGFQHHTLW